MIGDRFWRKLGPSLLHELSGPNLAEGATKPISIVAVCRPSGVSMLQRNHDLVACSEAIPFAALSLSKSEIRALARDRQVLFLEKDDWVISLPPHPPIDHQVANADVYARYKAGRLRDLDGDGVKIMVQDSGVSPHPDLPAEIPALDFTDEETTRDGHGHGTAIVSQMLAKGRFPGLVPKARVTMERIFDKLMRTSLSRILRASAAAIEQGAHIVSMSYGGPLPSPVIAFAMRRLHLEGICLVAAAGNSGPEEGTLEYPAGYPEVLAIAALDKTGQLARFSSRGRRGQRPMKPDLALEGVSIVMAASPDGHMGTPVVPGYIAASGTSFAAPIAACLAAMVLQSRGVRTPPDVVKDILYSSALK